MPGMKIPQHKKKKINKYLNGGDFNYLGGANEISEEIFLSSRNLLI